MSEPVGVRPKNLSQAKKNTENASITISGDGGTTSFSSDYEYELFALLPLIERLDEGRQLHDS